MLPRPTTGQDAETALEIVELCRKLARGSIAMKPKTIVMVIHQPRPEIFDMIDNLVLMASGGKLVYMGPRKNVLTVLGDRRGTALGNSGSEEEGNATAVNTADVMMDLLVGIGRDTSTKIARMQRTSSLHSMATDKGVLEKSDKSVKIEIPPHDTVGGMPTMWNRVSALGLKHYWSLSKGTAALMFFVIPFTTFFSGALPNGLSGGHPEAQELLVQASVRAAAGLLTVLGMIKGTKQ